MPTKQPLDQNTSPIPGVIPEPVHVERVPVSEEPVRSDPRAERDARRQARDERRGGVPAERPEVMIPRRRKRLPLEAPLMRVIATAGIVGIAVVIAAIMGSRDSQAWLIGLVASVASLLLAAGLWSSRRL